MTVLLEIELPRTLDVWVGELLAGTKGAKPASSVEPAESVEGWLFEGTAARRAAEQQLAAGGICARFMSAYKPLIHHFLEHVDCNALAQVVVHYPVHPNAPPRRFALEAYPLVDMVAGAQLHMEPQAVVAGTPQYRVELRWHNGARRSDTVFAPNRVHVDALGETLLSPTAWLSVKHRDGSIAEGRRESDYEALFRRAIECVQGHAWPGSEPYFERLDVRVDLRGIHCAPPQETGFLDTQEALHEDLYFSLMEIFQHRSGRPEGDRRMQPGQIVPDVRSSSDAIRLRVAVESYPKIAAVTETAADGVTSAIGSKTGCGDVPLAESVAPLTPARIAAELSRIAGQRFEATTRQGRTVAGVYRAGTGPAVIISGAQHANETSGVVGALRAAKVLAQQPDAHFALIPLENPDGYALHRELCAHAPRHMHHAARYTALGDDLEYRDAAPWYERAARHQALTLSGADLHINLHGYPAHEWTRPLSGYIPRGFGAWTIPKGFFLIVRHHAGWAERARQLATHVCKQLATRPALVAFNEKQLASYNAHAGDLPFEVIHGTACTISEVNRPGPALTLITEFPDETIYGDPFILAHDTQTATVLAAVEALGLISPSQ
ncbi:hypothetical protein RCH10_003804 [Variovorax sp. GrIS 2.14]|uniref:peptidase M14 n=1 Tax=Variovorax sp. GrIS 2.14 TaxID=3071709 RepID=UPI0038F61957